MKDQRPFRKRLKYGAIYYGLRFMIFLSRLFPRSWWLGIFGLLGRIGYQFSSKSRQRVIAHLTLAYGKEKSADEIMAMSKRVYVMLGKNAGDILRAWRHWTVPEFDKILKTHGMENV